ncbi:MAG: valine--tRNA ligase, partial [Desulfamplus sp.]|nr:valine--tRNA ligase [Desulfamplus sp.]
DLEVDHEDNDGFLYYIKYPFVNGSDGLIVATTRPETMFGDTAVAINPNDERYKNLDHKRVLLPLTNRIIPIIYDEYVDTEFGTGALKVTPAHDPNDFNLGEKHGLERLKVIGDDGNMNENAGEYSGLDRFQCRETAVDALDKLGLLVKKEPLKNSVGQCYRCKTVVEPALSRQWFVKTAPLAKMAADAVREGKTRIIPSNWTKTYFDWLDNIQDWCISRQIWWGHRIPVWKCYTCGQVIVEEFDPDKCDSCGSSDISQEVDVLDTWFSSALWPFSTMGWPQETDLLKTFYPTSALVTGFDILFFWVARMMMMGTRFMGDVPFKDVYIHALVRDEHGKKMSKSKGNVIDPLKVIDNYGADAFRFTLAAFAAQGRDVRMSEDRVEGYRNFVNKLWNAAKFTLMHLNNGVKESAEEEQFKITNIADKSYSISEHWILSRAAATAEAVKSGIENYRFNDAASSIYQFVWHEFCDWYLEAAKSALYEKEGQKRRDASRNVLAKVLKDILIMLHPFMPFVTEEIWHALPTVNGSVMESAFPEDNDPDHTFRNLEVEKSMEFIVAIITAIRNIRGEMNIQPSLQLNVVLHSSDVAEKQLITANTSLIENLSRLESLTISDTGDAPVACATAVVKGTIIYVSLKDVIDFDKEEQRLEKELEKVTKELVSVSKRLTNESFLDKAPDDVVEKVKEQQAMLQTKSDKLTFNLNKIRQMKL